GPARPSLPLRQRPHRVRPKPGAGSHPLRCGILSPGLRPGPSGANRRTLHQGSGRQKMPVDIAADEPRPSPILEIENLRTFFHTRDGVVRSVNGLSYSLGAGETLGIVGESGSGKSVAALSVLRL